MSRAIILHKGLEVGDIPQTPVSSKSDNLTLNHPRNLLLKYANTFGFPVGYAQEQNGQLIQNIIPQKKTESQQISSSSKTELALHTETAFHPYKPSTVLLLCLRADPKAVTTFAYVDEIVKYLAPETLITLTQPWFITSIDESFRTNNQPDMQLICSILKHKALGMGSFYEITYDDALMVGMNDQAQEALIQLKEAIRKCIHKIILESGDLLILNNKTTIHGRLPFDARYDGTDRWVQRALVINNLPPKSQRDQNIIITNFGKTN